VQFLVERDVVRELALEAADLLGVVLSGEKSTTSLLT
jgi:hypothetical protein